MASAWFGALAVAIGTFVVPLDVSAVVVALPKIRQAIGASFTDLLWVVDAYTLTFGGLLLTAGSLADLYGRRKIYICGLSLFIVSSMVAGRAPTPLLLIAARAIQGCAAALILSSGLSLLATNFQGRARATAFAIWASVMGSGVAMGPMIGGLVTSKLGWRWIFLLNVPVGLTAIALALARTRESRDPHAKRLDFGGLLTFTSAVFLLVYVLVSGNELGWASSRILGLSSAAVLLFVAFVKIERSQSRPMFDLTLFRNPTFIGASLAPIVLSISSWSLMLYYPQYFQAVLGYSPLKAGLALLPLTLPLFLFAPVGAKLAHRLPARFLLGGGLMVVAIGDVWVAAAGPDGSFLFGVGLLLAGIGGGIINGEISNVAISVVDPARSGMAAGICTTMRQVGFGTGIALLGAIYSNRAGPAAANSVRTSAMITIVLVAAAVGFLGSLAVTALVRDRDIARDAPPVAVVVNSR